LPYGHGYDNQIRDAGGGLLGGPPPRPGNDTPHDSAPHIQLLQDSPHHHPPFPKIEFPKFDGANPRLWQDLCECYFEVYAVHTAMKTRFATLNFKGAASTWLQTMERRGRIADWDKLCELVMAKFDKDQYQILLRQLDMLKQTAYVQEYQVEFDKLSHGVLLYNPAFDETFFVTRFMAGLRDEIRSAILLHRPSDVDTASALAMIQEQELEQSRTKSSGWNFTIGAARTVPGQDKYKQHEPVKPAGKWKEDTNDKLAMLKAFRRRNGLCFKCGEKWGPAHKCPAHVSLHVLEELLDAMDIVASAEDEHIDVEMPDDEQEVLTVQTEPIEADIEIVG
jgi:hypothetical protein